MISSIQLELDLRTGRRKRESSKNEKLESWELATFKLFKFPTWTQFKNRPPETGVIRKMKSLRRKKTHFQRRRTIEIYEKIYSNAPQISISKEWNGNTMYAGTYYVCRYVGT
jgi:hypothetical protein